MDSAKFVINALDAGFSSVKYHIFAMGQAELLVEALDTSPSFMEQIHFRVAHNPHFDFVEDVCSVVFSSFTSAEPNLLNLV